MKPCFGENDVRWFVTGVALLLWWCGGCIIIFTCVESCREDKLYYRHTL